MTPVIVVPCPKVKPAGPYSIFQVVSLPPAVQDNSACVSVMLEADKAVVVSQEGDETTILSTAQYHDQLPVQ